MYLKEFLVFYLTLMTFLVIILIGAVAFFGLVAVICCLVFLIIDKISEKIAYCYNRQTERIDIFDSNHQKIHSMSYDQLKYIVEQLSEERKIKIRNIINW